MKVCMHCGDTIPHILNLDIMWRQLLSHILQNKGGYTWTTLWSHHMNTIVKVAVTAASSHQYQKIVRFKMDSAEQAKVQNCSFCLILYKKYTQHSNTTTFCFKYLGNVWPIVDKYFQYRFGTWSYIAFAKQYGELQSILAFFPLYRTADVLYGLRFWKTDFPTCQSNRWKAV